MSCMKQKFIMMVGVPGSGKSTAAAHLKSLDESLVILSSDAIRAELIAKEADQIDGYTVFLIMQNRLEELLKAGRNVVYDAANLSRSRRRKLLQFIREIAPNAWLECHAFETPLDKCIINDAMRENGVGVDKIYRMWDNYVRPTLEEGWDETSIIGGYDRLSPVARHILEEAQTKAKDGLAPSKS